MSILLCYVFIRVQSKINDIEFLGQEQKSYPLRAKGWGFKAEKPKPFLLGKSQRLSFFKKKLNLPFFLYQSLRFCEKNQNHSKPLT